MSDSYKELVEDLQSIKSNVTSRVRMLVEQHIWDSVTIKDVEGWLSNFKLPEETLLAFLLLDELSLKSVKQVEALITHAINGCLPHALSENPLDALDMPDFLMELRYPKTEMDFLRFVPVIRDSDPPTKSGPSVARLYKRHAGIDDSYMIWPWQIGQKGDISTVVFIDDVLGTGRQFSEFIQKNLVNLDTSRKYIYIPLLAHEEGMRYIQNNYPQITLSPVETADDGSSFFERPFVKKYPDIKELYLTVSKKYINRRLHKKMALGYEDLSMTIGYSHGTPNSTLPLYWYNAANFSPLLKR